MSQTDTCPTGEQSTDDRFCSSNTGDTDYPLDAAQAQDDGEVALAITELETGRTLCETTLPAEARHLMEIKPTFDKHYSIHLQARFRAADGGQGISEFTSGSGVV